MSSSAISPRELAALPAARLPEEARGGPALILDLRSRRQQRRGRIPGSHSLPSGLLISGEAPEGDLILVADSSAQATAAAESLREAGYNRHLRHLDGGIPAWEAAGLPLTRPEPAGRPLTEMVCGGLLIAAAAFTQSLGMLALGLVLLFGPLVQACARAWVVAVSSDRLFPPHRQQELARGIGSGVTWSTIETDLGHDGFLLEQRQLDPILRQSLG